MADGHGNVSIPDDLFINQTIDRLEHLVSALDTMWTLTTSFFVFTMQVGFAFLEAGSVRSVNVITITFKNLADCAIGGVLWWLLGRYLAGDGSGALQPFIGTFEGSADASAADLLMYMYVTTGMTVVSGAVAERITITAYYTLVVLTSAFMFPTVVHWVWNDGGWLKDYGCIDFAGSMVIHLSGGTVSAVTAYVLGPRLLPGGLSPFTAMGKSVITPHNKFIQVAGAMILWFGWFGFNAGSIRSLVDGAKTAEVAAVSTAVGGSAAAVTSFIVLHWRQKHLDCAEVCNGLLGGLVSVTASCGFITAPVAMAIGATGSLVYMASNKVIVWLKIDDVVGAVSVHGCCGIFGSLCTIFANEEYLRLHFGDPDYNLDRASLLKSQCVGVLAVMAWSLMWGLVSAFALKRLNVLRVSPEHELDGCDGKFFHCYGYDYIGEVMTELQVEHNAEQSEAGEGRSCDHDSHDDERDGLLGGMQLLGVQINPERPGKFQLLKFDKFLESTVNRMETQRPTIDNTPPLSMATSLDKSHRDPVRSQPQPQPQPPHRSPPPPHQVVRVDSTERSSLNGNPLMPGESPPLPMPPPDPSRGGDTGPPAPEVTDPERARGGGSRPGSTSASPGPQTHTSSSVEGAPRPSPTTPASRGVDDSSTSTKVAISDLPKPPSTLRFECSTTDPRDDDTTGKRQSCISKPSEAWNTSWNGSGSQRLPRDTSNVSSILSTDARGRSPFEQEMTPPIAGLPGELSEKEADAAAVPLDPPPCESFLRPQGMPSTRDPAVPHPVQSRSESVARIAPPSRGTVQSQGSELKGASSAFGGPLFPDILNSFCAFDIAARPSSAGDCYSYGDDLSSKISISSAPAVFAHYGPQAMELAGLPPNPEQRGWRSSNPFMLRNFSGDVHDAAAAAVSPPVSEEVPPPPSPVRRVPSPKCFEKVGIPAPLPGGEPTGGSEFIQQRGRSFHSAPTITDFPDEMRKRPPSAPAACAGPAPVLPVERPKSGGSSDSSHMGPPPLPPSDIQCGNEQCRGNEWQNMRCRQGKTILKCVLCGTSKTFKSGCDTLKSCCQPFRNGNCPNANCEFLHLHAKRIV